MNVGVLVLALAWTLASQGGFAGEASSPHAIGNHSNQPPVYFSPTALGATADGRTLFVACATANQVAIFDTASNQVIQNIRVPGSPSGLALSRDEAWLYVTCAAPASTVCVIDAAKGVLSHKIAAGHTALSPVLSPDGKTLYVCNRFNHDLSVIDLTARQEIRRIRVSREPVAAAVTPDGKFLIVGNHLYDQPADGPGIAATLSIIDTAAGRVTKQLKLPRGSGLIRGVALSPDGRYAAVTHLLARYYLPTTNVNLGQINANGMSLVDMRRQEVIRYMPLDQPDRGAANPWAVGWTPDGRYIAVTHAGTHEVSLVDAPAWLKKRIRRQRVELSGNGPRALAIVGSRIYVANYFSDNLCRIDYTAPEPKAVPLALAPVQPLTLARQGEMLFNDAKLCFQEWQSCASCHDADARMDGMKWDLLNDGQGNPKNAKSLLFAHQTPPAMWLGIRATAEVAVRSGIRFILFTQQPESVPLAIDEYLKSLLPIPSPYLVNGELSAAAQRGKQIFMNRAVGCANCHKPAVFTDQRSHDVGTRGHYDQATDIFDTPTLLELWRTAPYLHDGSAATVRDVFNATTSRDRHGKTSHLTRREIDDLELFLLSL